MRSKKYFQTADRAFGRKYFFSAALLLLRALDSGQRAGDAGRKGGVAGEKRLAKVDDARFGRAIAGLVTRMLSVEDVVRRDKEICVLVRSSGKTGVKEFGVCIKGRQVSCSCSDYRKRGVHCKHIAAVALYE